ncbi:arginine N-succinyltransferase [Halodesulfovibrio marinisediminis]|uniref:Arginine N-succinyltransferase beta subunit n=1 Tax=Halodesulfovibrio marinisediminis DSM 17456 TaxID=1121457 RepID=A0A1N6GSB9_9BACT|nr:arginine N-succinyltransferase [Halodesulfovibrio marinisediminis]SIO10426.1 Arginine N-succinyltransferase beta subunit [Halodesulfovibrio marinisediminis DSM 17456]
MRFIVRGARHEDHDELCRLAYQAPLLSLQPSPDLLSKRIETSLQSFAGILPPGKCEYQFVCEDLATKRIAGASSLFGSYISEAQPQHYIDVINEEDHQKYIRGIETQRTSGLGGLIVDDMFRKTHYKLAAQLSHIRVLYAGIKPERFTDSFVVEVLGKITAKGESRFWDCFGKKFTGMSFIEAYKRMANKDRSFMNMFPNEYELPDGCSKQRISENSVGMSSRGSQHLAKRLGFTFQNRVDPVDGTLCYKATRNELSPLRNGKWYTLKKGSIKGDIHLMGSLKENGEFSGAIAHCGFQNGIAVIRENICAALGLIEGDRVFVSPHC